VKASTPQGIRSQAARRGYACSVARAIRIDELAGVRVAGVNWKPIRRELGVTGFGISAFSADRGEQLIEAHDETAGGAGGHEEIYLVLRGHAAFTVSGEEIDAPAGTLVFVPELTARRSAIALEGGTIVLVVGGAPGTVTPSPWEYYFAAAPAAAAGEPGRAYEIAAAALTDHPDNAALHFNLACFASLAGERERALDHISRAVEADPAALEWAAADRDLDPVRADPRFPA